jgi:C-terminal processing protease CtpA/Prc
MQRIAYWLIPLIAISVVVFLGFFIYAINEEGSFESSSREGIVVKNSFDDDHSIWVEALSKNERQGYAYPLNEVYLELELSKKIIKERTYRLTTNIHDPYQLFCLKQELKALNLRYSLKKDNNGVELLIESKKYENLKSLVSSLKNYEINAKIKLYKEVSK